MARTHAHGARCKHAACGEGHGTKRAHPVEEVTVDTGKKGGNPITNAIKGFFAWGRGLYP